MGIFSPDFHRASHRGQPLTVQSRSLSTENGETRGHAIKRYLAKRPVPLSTDAPGDRVHRILVESLYQNPSSLAMGAIVGVTTSVVISSDSNNRVISLLAATVAVVAILRVIAAYWLNYRKHGNVKLLEWVFEIGAFSYALALGTLAAACVAMGAPTIIQLMSVTAAIGYGAGISARNAGRLPIAIGQLMLSITPTCVVLMFLPGFASKVLAVSLGLFVVVMISIGLNVFRTLRSSIAAADTSARLADQMREQARTDVVTGLLNRAGLNHELVELLMQLPADQKLALFWLDLDRFKEVNDTLGHPVGDRRAGRSRPAAHRHRPRRRGHRPLRRRRVYRRLHRSRPRRVRTARQRDHRRHLAALSDRRPPAQRRHVDGRRHAARRRARYRHGDAGRRPRALPRQGQRPEPVAVLRPVDDPRPRAPQGDRERTARRDPEGRAVDLLPADRRSRNRQDPHLRGAGSLVPPGEGRAAPRRIHSGGRGDRGDHHARQLDHRAGGQGLRHMARGRHPRGQPLAGADPRAGRRAGHSQRASRSQARSLRGSNSK